jgi:hypothetical protein
MKHSVAPWNPSGARRLGASRVLRAVALGLLLSTAVVGWTREWRLDRLTADIVSSLGPSQELDTVTGAAKAVQRRFAELAQHGASGSGGSPGVHWLFRTAADGLLTGGDCGVAARALASVFDSIGQPFRVVRANLGPWGASHVLTEALLSDGRWVLLEPLVDSSFMSPDGRWLTIEEIRALPVADRGWLDARYREDGEWSLYAPFDRCPLALLCRIAGDTSFGSSQWVAVLRIKARLIEPGGELATVAVAILALWGLCGLRVWRRRRSSGPSMDSAPTPQASGSPPAGGGGA